jgi:hypothetical protein
MHKFEGLYNRTKAGILKLIGHLYVNFSHFNLDFYQPFNLLTSNLKL